jgi:hypothetical protein
VVAVQAGDRLVLRTARRAVSTRALAAVDLTGAWTVPVLADVHGAGRGRLELPGPAGLVQVEAELVVQHHGLFLCSVDSAPAHLVQRRAHTRAVVDLPVRGAVLTTGPPAGSTAPAGELEELDEQMWGRTLSMSGGGLSVHWDHAPHLARGARLYLELQMPDGVPVPVVVSVVAARRYHARVRFLDIAPVDTDRLVGLVFQAQRLAVRQSRGHRPPDPAATRIEVPHPR